MSSSNEAPAELRQRVASLRDITGTVWDLTDVVGQLSQELNRALCVESEYAVREMLQEYSLHHWPTGKDVELVDTDRAARIEGRCLGIDSQGRLLVKTEQGSHALLTGSIVSVNAPGDTYHDPFEAEVI